MWPPAGLRAAPALSTAAESRWYTLSTPMTAVRRTYGCASVRPCCIGDICARPGRHNRRHVCPHRGRAPELRGRVPLALRSARLAVLRTEGAR